VNEHFVLPLIEIFIYGNFYYMFKWRINVRNVGRKYKHLLKRLEKIHFVAYNVSQRPAFYCFENKKKLCLLIHFPNRTSELVKKEFVYDFADYTHFEIEDLKIDPRRTYVTFDKLPR
jgi:hypothetical protein